MVKPYRGSRKHVLDLLDSGRFAETMTALLSKHGVSISIYDTWRPLGSLEDEEWDLRRFCATLLGLDMDSGAFDVWWVPSRYRNPQWDLLATCAIDGRPGLLLVEAKANAAELSAAGKPLATSASPRTRENHAVIGKCIDEANAALNAVLPGFAISRDTHYQLSNRIAFAWKLACCGLPVVLLYLGFTGDDGIVGVGEPIAGQGHWQRIMGAYMSGVAPLHFPDVTIEVEGGGSLRMAVESLPVLGPSPPSGPSQK